MLIAQKLLDESEALPVNKETPAGGVKATEELFRAEAVLCMQHDDRDFYVFSDRSIICNDNGAPSIGEGQITTKTIPRAKFWDELFPNPLCRTLLLGSENIRANTDEMKNMSRNQLEQWLEKHLRSKGNFVIVDFVGVSLKIISLGDYFRLEVVSIVDNGYSVKKVEGMHYAQPLGDAEK